MRKATALAAAFTFVLFVLPLISSCGGNKAEAVSYMKKGDQIVARLQSEASQWSSEISSAITSMADPVKSKDEADKAKATGETLARTADSAKAEYAKIRSLEGVEDYVKYANLEIDALDLNIQLVKKTGEFLDEITALAAAGDLAGIGTAKQMFQQEVDSLHNRILELDEQAQNLKADKNL